MNFRPHDRDEPELNLIPLIDVLIILLIFLVMTTTFAHQRSLEIQLPKAEGTTAIAPDRPLTIKIDPEGHYQIGDQRIDGDAARDLRDALKLAAGDQKDPLIIIEADRNSRHQALVTTLEALGELSFNRISFETLPSH